MDRFAARALRALLAISLVAFFAACSSSDDGDSSAPPADETAPTVVASYPADGATGVTLSGPFWVAFSEPMEEETVLSNLSFEPTVTYAAVWHGDTLVVTPGVLLSTGTPYTMTVGAGCEDAAGNALGADVAIAFTTTAAADNVPPTVVSTVPADGEMDVLGTTVIEIAFSEPMNSMSVWDALSVTPSPADMWMEWDATTLLVHHTAFDTETQVTVTIGVGAMDLAGNHLASPCLFDFTTRADDERPYLVSATPANGATGISVGLASVVMNFSEPMDPNSFDMPYDAIDARFMQAMVEEPYWNGDYSTVTIPVGKTLLPGCTYWVRLLDVTDAGGNAIDPNPTEYQFTTTGTQTVYPASNGDLWYFRNSYDATVTRTIENYVPSTGTFDEVRRNGVGTILEKVHLRKSGSDFYYLGRDEYDAGTYLFTMTWDTPLTYLRLPLQSYLGASWPFSATATIDATMSMTITGRVEIEPATVTVVSDELRGTFRGCYVHHLYVDYVMYDNGNPVDSGSVHQITWLSPGVGPVRFVNTDGGGADTVSVYDWNL